MLNSKLSNPLALDFKLNAYLSENPLRIGLEGLEKLARKHISFPLRVIYENNRPCILLAMKNTADIEAVTDFEFHTGMTIIPVPAKEVDIRCLIFTYYSLNKAERKASTHH